MESRINPADQVGAPLRQRLVRLVVGKNRQVHDEARRLLNGCIDRQLHLASNGGHAGITRFFHCQAPHRVGPEVMAERCALGCDIRLALDNRGDDVTLALGVDGVARNT